MDADFNSGMAASAIALVFRVQSLSTADSTWHEAELALCVYVPQIFLFLYFFIFIFLMI